MAKTKARQKANRTSVKSKYKMKTKRAAHKRYKVLPSGKVKVPHSGKCHNTGPKARTRKTRLKKMKMMRPESMTLVRRCLPNSF